MSLTEVNLVDIVKKQYKYKLKAYFGVFSSLLAVQLIALFFSSNGAGQSGSGGQDYSLNISYYTSDIVIILTMLWAFITAILVTTKAYRNDDFAFVTNRVSSNLSTIVFLVTASLIAGLTAVLSGFLLKVVMYFVQGADSLVVTVTTPLEIVLSIVAAFLYMLLFSALGYFVGMLSQFSKLFMILLPALFFGALFSGARLNGEPTIIIHAINFFGKETSIFLFFIKVLVVTLILFYGSIVVSNRLEVRK